MVVKPQFSCLAITLDLGKLMTVKLWSRHHEPWFNNGMTTTVEPWFHGQFYHGTPVLVNLDKSLEVDENRSKSGSKTNNHLFTPMPYFFSC